MHDYIIITADGEVRGRFSQISLARAEKNRIHREEGIDVTIETRQAMQMELPIGITLEAIQKDPDLTLHHKSMRRGYIPRRTDHVIEPYRGKFGEGYVVSYPRYDSTRYVTIEYYVRVPSRTGGCRSNVRRSTGWACTRGGEAVVIDGKRCQDTKPCFEPRGGGNENE